MESQSSLSSFVPLRLMLLYLLLIQPSQSNKIPHLHDLILYLPIHISVFTLGVVYYN